MMKLLRFLAPSFAAASSGTARQTVPRVGQYPEDMKRETLAAASDGAQDVGFFPSASDLGNLAEIPK